MFLKAFISSFPKSSSFNDSNGTMNYSSTFSSSIWKILTDADL